MENSTAVGYLNAAIKNNLFVTLGVLCEGKPDEEYEYNKTIFCSNEKDMLQQDIAEYCEDINTEIFNYLKMVVSANKTKLPSHEAIIAYNLEYKKRPESYYISVELHMKPTI
jgi:hypothetical protein